VFWFVSEIHRKNCIFFEVLCEIHVRDIETALLRITYPKGNRIKEKIGKKLRF